MRKFGMGKTSLLGLDSNLRFVQQTAGCAMCGPFRLQGGFQFCDPRLERCRRIVVTPAVENNHRHSAILHETVAGTHLVSTLLRGLPGWTLQAQGTAHSVFSCLRVAW